MPCLSAATVTRTARGVFARCWQRESFNAKSTPCVLSPNHVISALRHFCISARREKGMYITVTHYKGGVGKTTTAVHLAAYLQQQAPTLFIDGDPVRSATKWAAKGKGMPFAIVDGEEGDY